MNGYEMEGFLRGNGIPGDLKVNESNAQYLVRKFSELQSQNADLAVQLANAESKCRDLAGVVAENAALKAAAKETLAHWDAAEAGKMEMMMDKCMPALRDAYCKTPATDTFLAEVRAQGVEMFAEMYACEAIKDGEVEGWKSKVSNAASEYATQLRQGAAQ